MSQVATRVVPPTKPWEGGRDEVNGSLGSVFECRGTKVAKGTVGVDAGTGTPGDRVPAGLFILFYYVLVGPPY